MLVWLSVLPLFASASERLRDPRTCRDKDRGGNKGGRRAAKIRTMSREDAVLACAQVGLAPFSARVSWPKPNACLSFLQYRSMRTPLSLLLSAYLLSHLYGACRVIIALGADGSILPVAFNQPAWTMLALLRALRLSMYTTPPCL